MSDQTAITFENRRGEKLAGILHGDPQGSCVISCHGMLSNKEGKKHGLLARYLSERGVSMLRFDFAGRGESEGSMENMSYTSEMHDLDAAVEYLAARGVQRVGVFGSSMGGAVALLTAARDERIVAIATLAAVGYPAALEERYPGDVRRWRERGYIDFDQGRLGVGFLDDAMSHDVVSATQVLRAPVLVVHGIEDEVVPVSEAHDIAASARNVSLHLVDGADHRFSDPIHLRPTMAHIADFLTKHVAQTA